MCQGGRSSPRFKREVGDVTVTYRTGKVIEYRDQIKYISGILIMESEFCCKIRMEKLWRIPYFQLRNGGAQTNDSSEEIDKLVAERSELQVKVEEVWIPVKSLSK